MDHEIARTLRTILQHQSGLHCVRFLPPCCPVWLMVMIDEFHGLDATARLVLYALRPRSSSSSLSPRISLRFLALLIYFHIAGQQQSSHSHSSCCCCPIWYNWTLLYILYAFYWTHCPRPSLSFRLSSFRFLSQCWISVTRRATRNAFLAFRTFPTFA